LKPDQIPAPPSSLARRSFYPTSFKPAKSLRFDGGANTYSVVLGVKRDRNQHVDGE